MEKYVLKITLAVVIIILIGVYAFNACSLEEPAAWDYRVVAGKSYEAGYGCVANKTASHVTDDVFFSISRGEEVIVVDRKFNYAKVSKEINGNVEMGYIDAYYLSEDAKTINNVEPSLVVLEDAEGYYTPSLSYEEKYANKFNGVAKTIAKANGFVKVKLADFNANNNEQIWIKEENVKQYNSLKVDLGRIKSEAQIFADEKMLDRASETLRDKIMNSDYLKVVADLDEHLKLQNKDGDICVIEKADFLPLSDPSLIK